MKTKFVILLAACLLLITRNGVGAEITTEAATAAKGCAVLVCDGVTITISPDVAVNFSADSGKVKAQLDGLTITATSMRLELHGAVCEMRSGLDGTLSVTSTPTENGEGAAVQPPSAYLAYDSLIATPSDFAECYAPPPSQEQLMIFPVLWAEHASAVPSTRRIMFGSWVTDQQ